MVSEDCGSVALSNPPHSDMQHAMGRLNVVLLNKTTNIHHPVTSSNKQHNNRGGGASEDHAENKTQQDG